jgi:hypothetical protein
VIGHIGSVDSNGLFTATSVGAGWVDAYVNGIRGKLTIYVTDTAYTFDPSKYTYVAVKNDGSGNLVPLDDAIVSYNSTTLGNTDSNGIFSTDQLGSTSWPSIRKEFYTYFFQYCSSQRQQISLCYVRKDDEPRGNITGTGEVVSFGYANSRVVAKIGEVLYGVRSIGVPGSSSAPNYPNFNFYNVPVGTYEVTFEWSSISPVSVSDITVAESQEVILNFMNDGTIIQ